MCCFVLSHRPANINHVNLEENGAFDEVAIPLLELDKRLPGMI